MEAAGRVELVFRRAGQRVAERQRPDVEARQQTAWRGVAPVPSPTERGLLSQLFESALASHAPDEKQTRAARIQHQPHRLALVADGCLDHGTAHAAPLTREQLQRKLDPPGTLVEHPQLPLTERAQRAQRSARGLDAVGIVAFGQLEVSLDASHRLGAARRRLGRAHPDVAVRGRRGDGTVHQLDRLRPVAARQTQQPQQAQRPPTRSIARLELLENLLGLLEPTGTVERLAPGRRDARRIGIGAVAALGGFEGLPPAIEGDQHGDVALKRAAIAGSRIEQTRETPFGLFQLAREQQLACLDTSDGIGVGDRRPDRGREQREQGRGVPGVRLHDRSSPCWMNSSARQRLRVAASSSQRGRDRS